MLSCKWSSEDGKLIHWNLDTGASITEVTAHTDTRTRLGFRV